MPLSRERPRDADLPVLLGIGTAQIITWGVLYYAFSLMVRPMELSLGWSRTLVTGAFSVALLVAGVAALPIGRWLDARGPRALVTGGSVAAVLLLVAWSRVTSPVLFYLVWAGIGATMATQLYEPAFWIAVRWFPERTARALTIITVLGGLASPVFLPFTSWLLQHYEWRRAILILAGTLAVTVVPLHALVLRRRHRPTTSPPRHDGGPRSAYRHPSLWWLTTAFVLNGFSTAAVTVHFVPFLLEQRHPLAFAAAAAGLIGGMQVFARLLFTPVRDALPAGFPLASVLLMQVMALAALPFASAPSAALLFAACFGAANGLLTLLRASRIADIFGTATYGALSGVIAAGSTLSRASGPVLAGFLYTRRHDYVGVFVALIVANVLSFTSAAIAERLALRAAESRTI